MQERPGEPGLGRRCGVRCLLSEDRGVWELPRLCVYRAREGKLRRALSWREVSNKCRTIADEWNRARLHGSQTGRPPHWRLSHQRDYGRPRGGGSSGSNSEGGCPTSHDMEVSATYGVQRYSFSPISANRGNSLTLTAQYDIFIQD